MHLGYHEIGLALDSHDCVVLSSRRPGELEEKRMPALAEVRGKEVGAIGRRAYRLVGKSREIVRIFPGRIEDPTVLGGYLEKIVPKKLSLARRRIWASVPTAASLQLQLNLLQCLDHYLSAKEIVLVPELLAAALGAGFPVLGSDEQSHRGRMIVHVSGTRIAAGVFVDGRLVGLTDREGSWDRVVREIQETLQFCLGATMGYNTFFKLVRRLSRTFFERQNGQLRRRPVSAAEATFAGPPEDASSDLDLSGESALEPAGPASLRSFNDRGLIEYVVEDENISRAIDYQLKTILLSLEKVIFGCFAQLRNSGRGEIANDLFTDRIMVGGDLYFDPEALSGHFTRLTRFPFEAVPGNPVPKGLRTVLMASKAQKESYRGIAETIQENERLYYSRL